MYYIASLMAFKMPKLMLKISNKKKVDFFSTKYCVLKKKLYLCTRKKVRKNNFANEIVKGPDKLNVRGFCTVSN